MREIKRLVLLIMVWKMRWMTRHLGFIARPFVRWVADQEVIACGLRREDSQVSIIYTPYPDRIDHTVYKKEKGKWQKVEVRAVENFSGDLVHQLIVPNAQVGEEYVIRAKKKSGRVISSPKITVKEHSDKLPEMLEVKPFAEGRAHFRWKVDRRYDPMIYFLALEDSEKHSLAGIYTREKFFKYPFLKTASLSVGESEPKLLESDKSYTAKLVVVDFDGWVCCKTDKFFQA